MKVLLEFADLDVLVRVLFVFQQSIDVSQSRLRWFDFAVKVGVLFILTHATSSHEMLTTDENLSASRLASEQWREDCSTWAGERRRLVIDSAAG